MATHIVHTQHDVHPMLSAPSARMAQTGVNTLYLALGRAIFGLYFVYSGLDHFTHTAELAAAAAAKHTPEPQLAVLFSGALILIGGLSILTGMWPRMGAGLIALFLIGVTPVMHTFWSDPTPAEQTADLVNFTKNIALLGAACFVAALPTPWPGTLIARHPRIESHEDL